MDDFLNIVQMSDDDIVSYVNGKMLGLNSSISYDDISLGDEGVIYSGWINLDTVYRPSGYRSKGFIFTKDFYIDWCKFIRENFGMIDIKKLSSNINDTIIIKAIHLFINYYFGEGYNEERRKEIYCHGNWQVANESINISTIKNENVARCIEKAAAFNGIANTIGLDCSLVLSDAKLNGGDKIGHAYCLLNLNGKYIICDSTFSGRNNTNRGIPFIFDLNGEKVVFDSGKFGDIEPKTVEYDFPWNEFRKINGRLYK